MRRGRDFAPDPQCRLKAAKVTAEPAYDIWEDFAAIEASFAMQYGIRLAQEDIAVGEFLRLLAHLMPDTPLGVLVATRRGGNLPPDSDIADLQKRLAEIFS